MLSAAALAGGTSAVVGAAQKGDGLGIAAGLLQVAAAAADGTIAAQGGGSADLKLGALGLSVAAGATRLADGAQTGDLVTALGDVGALAAAVASAVQQAKTDPQVRARLDQLVAAVVASPPAVPVGSGAQVAQNMAPGSNTYPDANGKIKSYTGTLTAADQTVEATAGDPDPGAGYIKIAPPDPSGNNLLDSLGKLAGKVYQIVRGGPVRAGSEIASIVFESSPTNAGSSGSTTLPDGTELVYQRQDMYASILTKSNAGRLTLAADGTLVDSTGQVAGVRVRIEPDFTTGTSTLQMSNGLSIGYISNTGFYVDPNFSKQPSYRIGASDDGPGTWEASPKYPTDPADAAYQRTATGAPDGVEYRVATSRMSTGVKWFDGYNPSTNRLIDAKNYVDWPKPNLKFSMTEAQTSLTDDAAIAAEKGSTLEVRVTTQEKADLLQDIVRAAGIKNVVIIKWPVP